MPLDPLPRCSAVRRAPGAWTHGNTLGEACPLVGTARRLQGVCGCLWGCTREVPALRCRVNFLIHQLNRIGSPNSLKERTRIMMNRRSTVLPLGVATVILALAATAYAVDM